MQLPRRITGSDQREAPGVTTLELFFDLVFAFTVTQLASTVEHGDGLAGLGRAALLLLLLWWMYGGYVWLTNNAPPVTTRRRLFLLLAMVGNFVCALSVPHAFTTDRWPFAIGYAVVVLVHAAMFLTDSANLNARMVRQLLVWNLSGVLIILVGAAVGGRALVALWVLSLFIQGVLPRLLQVRGNDREAQTYFIVPAHFVERHGLMLIIVLGESVLAIGAGIGTGSHHIGVAQIAFSAIALTLAASLYWSYFGAHEDQHAEAALAATTGRRTGSLALTTFGYAYYVMLLGIVVAAAGLNIALINPLAGLSWLHAGQLAGGIACYWLGLAWFRWGLGRNPTTWLFTGLLAGAAGLLGVQMALLGLIAILFTCMLAIQLDQRLERRTRTKATE